MIELIESEEMGSIAVGESTVPPFVGLIRRLGINEREFIRATEATYKLGIQFVGWHQRNKKYFHPFGVIGRSIGNHDFYQCWLKARAHGDTSSLLDFSPCNVMAENGRFFPPAEARNTPIGGANYALHVDALLVARYLRRYAEARGLARIEGKVTRVTQREDGFIRSVALADGREIQGRFLHRLHGFQGAFDRPDAGCRFRGLVELFAVRPRHRGQDGQPKAAASLYARHGSAGGMELADTLAASHGAGLCVLEPILQRRRREIDADAQPGRSRPRRSSHHPVHHRTSQRVLEDTIVFRSALPRVLSSRWRRHPSI